MGEGIGKLDAAMAAEKRHMLLHRKLDGTSEAGLTGRKIENCAHQAVDAGIGIAAKTAGPIGTRIICEDIGLFVTGATGRPLTLAMPATCG